jgi:HSP20 family molecular chaperone IbpA
MTDHDTNPFKGIFPGAEEFLNTLFGGFAPSVVTTTPKYKDTEEYVEYKFPLPGVPQDRIVPVAKSTSLTVSVIDNETGREKTVYRVLLKPGLNHEGAVAEAKDGLLTIQIPYSETRSGVKVGFGKLQEEPAHEEKPAEESRNDVPNL